MIPNETSRNPVVDHRVEIRDYSMIENLKDAVLVGNWFVFFKSSWLARSGVDKLLATANIPVTSVPPAIAFRGGKDPLTLPGVHIQPTPLPSPMLVSLTCDKALYRAQRDTVRLLVAAPQAPRKTAKLSLRLSGNPYADYPVTLDEYGLALWSMQNLPEGEYEATVRIAESATEPITCPFCQAVQTQPATFCFQCGNQLEAAAARDYTSDPCRFEVAEYRLAPLNADLVEQTLNGNELSYTLHITAFGQPFVGSVEVELQERGQRVGSRKRVSGDDQGNFRGSVELTGAGPYSLNVFAGERTATVALKGSEQARRETLTISELGEVQVLSLLPLPDAEACRNLYVSSERNNTAPFLVRRLIGQEVEIIPRTSSELLRVVVVDPTSGTVSESLHEQLQPNQPLRLPLPAPYGLVLLGAFIEEKAWEGWCAVLRPSALQLSCEAPAEVRPGSRVTITLKTNRAERSVPVQLIVKDQRLVAPSDPQVELAASIKKNLEEWNKLSTTGEVEHQLTDYQGGGIAYASGAVMFRAMAAPLPPPMAPVPGGPPVMSASGGPPPRPGGVGPRRGPGRGVVSRAMAASQIREKDQMEFGAADTLAPAQTLTRVRMQFPEIIYNNIVHVQGEEQIEVKLGDSMTRYSIEAFALDRETLDWQRAEAAIDATQPVYGELTVSPFVREGDPVLGRLDVGAASGQARVEIRLNETLLPLFDEAGHPLAADALISSGSVVRFPVRPGALTAIVRDAQSGEADVSERYITEPGKLRHIMRRLRLLIPGDEVTLRSSPDLLELRPMPGLERPFQFFVEGAAKYPFGCIEQTSMKLVAQYTGYITNEANAEAARDYEAAIIAWHKRLKSMYLPKQGFCFYPPEDGGTRKTDTHYAPRGVKHLLNLPDSKRSGIKSQVLCELLDDIHVMVKEAAAYYKIANPPTKIQDCHDAYKILASDASPNEKARAASFVRSRLKERNGQTYAEVPEDQQSYRLWGRAVSTREETAYAAAALFVAQEPADLGQAIAATNFLTAQLNEEGRLYSTVDTAACLVLLLALRDAGVVVSGTSGRVAVNGQEMELGAALAYAGKVESLRCVEGVVAVQLTSEIFEDWSKFQSGLPVEVALERKGRTQKRFKVGDDLELVIRIPSYEPGLLAHVCLPDALARVVGGGQVKRFSLDFCEKNELRVPLAAVGATQFPGEESQNILARWFKLGNNENAQHWAVIVRNMFKEEQVGNPGLLRVIVE
jgi:hypothetical protein